MKTLADDVRNLPPGAMDGASCPHCQQFYKIYRRSLICTMARQLLLLRKFFRNNPGVEWVQASKYLTNCKIDRECAKLRYWGLIEEKAGDSLVGGGPHSGLYKVTPLGDQFALYQVSLAKYCYIYNDQFLGLSDGVYTTLKITDIQKALGTKFNYHDLMR